MSIIASASNHLKFHRWSDGSIQHRYVPARYDQGHIKSISWSKDGAWIVLVPHSGPAEILRIQDNVKLLQQIIEIQYPSCAIFQNTTKKNIAVGTTSGQVLIYDVKSRKIKGWFPKACSMINQLQYNAKDSHLAAACANGGIFVYNNMTKNLSASYKMPKSNSVSSITFHRCKRKLLGAGDDGGMVAVWDINSNLPLLDVQAHTAPTTTLIFSPLRGDMLVTGGLDRRFTFYDILVKKYIVEIEVASSATTLDFSYCGIYLGMGLQSGDVVLYDTRNLSKSVLTFPAHQSRSVRHLVFQKVLGSQDNSILDIPEIHSNLSNQLKEECNNQSVGSLAVAFGEDSVSVCENDKKAVQEAQDSFLAALGWNNSSTTEVNKESGIGLCPSGTEKSIDVTRNLSQVLHLKRSVQTSLPLNITHSISRCLRDDLHSTEISPIAGPIKRTPKNVSLRNNVTANSTPQENSNLNPMNLSPDELKDMLKEVITGEFESQLEDYKNVVKTELAEHYDNMNRRILDVQMSIATLFTGMVANLENMANELAGIKNQIKEMNKKNNLTYF